MGNISEAVMNKKNVKRDENQTGVVCGARGETTSRRNEGGRNNPKLAYSLK
jgi:hypothetical protein